MRFLHTADWHIGRALHGHSLLDDQHYALSQVVAIARDERPDFLLVAGDVYDRTAPSGEAVELLSDILEQITLGLQVPVFFIAGNHDCPKRLGFGAGLFARNGLNIAGSFSARHCDRPLVLREVNVFLLPYAEPPVCRERLEDESIVCHDSAMRAAVARIQHAHEAGRPSILVAHAFVDGGTATDSERPLSIGGAGTVSAQHFAEFDYVALGHLHRPQNVGESGTVRYSGSLLKYSFSEADHCKSVTMVELTANGSGPARWQEIPLAPRRELSTLSGRFHDLMAQGAASAQRDHYLSVELLDDFMVLDAFGRLREVYPHLLHVDRKALRIAAEDSFSVVDRRKVGVESLFEVFYLDVSGAELTPDERAAFREAAARIPAEKRETIVG